MSKTLFDVSAPLFTSADMTMSTGTRVYLQKDGITQLLKSENTSLARDRRRLAIGYYNSMKAIHGPAKAAEMQDEYIQSFEYKQKGLIIYTKHEDKWYPIYAVGTGPGFVGAAWFNKNQDAVKRLRTQKSVEKAETAFNTFVANYTPSDKMTTWYNQMVLDTRSTIAEQYVTVTAAKS
tara:strand:- start:1344 stop:1877 length:534 start_codon:yes stop_codon:yes gene_type:complete